MAQQQLDAMKAVQDGQTKVKQQELNQSLSDQQKQLEQLRDVQIQRANDVQAQAMRMAQLIGTPPPEKNAEAPVVAGGTGPKAFKGKSSLRINRPVATTSGQGSGLNIT
jgi:hypothetical protein